MIRRINKACKYFPCHRGLEDCTFCYCPFYPCEDRRRGKYVYSLKLKKTVWSCKGCNWIHKKSVVDRIYQFIKEIQGELFPESPAKKKIKEPETGIVILGHGSRLKKANDLIPEVIKTIKSRMGLVNVAAAYLQLATPDLSRSVKGLIRRGCRKIIIVPFFLFVGNHVSRDIPEIIERERKRCPEVDFIYTENLGADSRIADIVADKIEKGLGV